MSDLDFESVEFFIEGVKSKDFNRNMSALNEANKLMMSSGNYIDFAELLTEIDVSERLESVLDVFDFSDGNTSPIYEGGKKAFEYFIQTLAVDGCMPPLEKIASVVSLESIDKTMVSFSDNETALRELNISKSEYALYRKMYDADCFDVSIALSINQRSNELYDFLKPDYIEHYMSVDDVKALVSVLDNAIEFDGNKKNLNEDIKRFVRISGKTNVLPEDNFVVMAALANSKVYGVEEADVFQKLYDEADIDRDAIKKVYEKLEREYSNKATENKRRTGLEKTDEDFAAEFDEEFDVVEHEPIRKKKRFGM